MILIRNLQLKMNQKSLLISLDKKRSVTKVAPYQFQRHQSTFCLSKTKMKPILQVRKNRILLLSFNVLSISDLFLPLKVLPISHLFLPIKVPPISHPLLPLNILPISHLLLLLNVLLISHLLPLLLDVIAIRYPNLLLLLQLLYPKTPRNVSKAQ